MEENNESIENEIINKANIDLSNFVSENSDIIFEILYPKVLAKLQKSSESSEIFFRCNNKFQKNILYEIIACCTEKKPELANKLEKIQIQYKKKNGSKELVRKLANHLSK